MKRVIFDYTFSITPPLNKENGISLNEIEKEYSKAKIALSNLLKKNPGFLSLPSLSRLKEIYNFAQKKRDFLENLVLIGIGGSSLGTQALIQSLMPYYYNFLPERERFRKPKIFFLDNIDPSMISSFLKTINLRKSLFMVISKSGSTVETLTNFILIRERLKNELKGEFKNHIIAITNSREGELLKIAKRDGIKNFDFPDPLGGRYSVLSIVSLLPASFMDINPEEIVEGAKAIKETITSEEIYKNPAIFSALLYILFYRKGKNIQIIMPYSSKLERLAEWYCQLWAESLGKRYTIDGKEINWGQTPVRVIGTKDQHSQVQLYIEGPSDKIITFWETEKFDEDIKIKVSIKDLSLKEYLNNKKLSEVFKAEKKATEIALAENNKPSVSFIIPELNPFFVGQFVFILEMQTAIAGEILNINPFDQPGVELGKKYALAILNPKKHKKSELMNIKRYRI